MASKYSIIHFLDEETVEIVPVSWIKEKADGKTECYWPPTNFPAKLIMRAACPDEKYSLHACRVMQTYDDYATARMYLPKAEFYSDIEYKSQNESLGKRKRKPNKIQFSSSSEEEEESEEEEGEKEKESQVKKMKVIAKKCTIPESLSRKASNFERSKEIFKNCSAAQKEVVSTLSTSTPPKNIVSKSSDSSLPKTVMSRLSSSSPPQKFVPRSSLISSNGEEMSSNICLQSISDVETDHQRLDPCSNSSASGMQTGKKIKKVDNTPFEREVLKNQMLMKTAIYEIMDTIHDLSDEVKKLQQSSKNSKAKEFVTEKIYLPQFPIMTIQDLEALEGLLMEKPEACIELAQMFELRKHKDAPSTIRRGLMLIFHPLLARSVSWKGYNNNFKFENTKTAKILCETVQVIFKVEIRTMETAIINWFRHSKDKKSKDNDNSKDQDEDK